MIILSWYGNGRLLYYHFLPSYPRSRNGLHQTYGSLASFMLAMVRNPDVLRRAREEIDNVVGSSRLPEFADRDNLPYLSALVEEVYRYVNPRY